MLPHQHGLMKSHSCEIAHINLMASIFVSRDQGLHSAIAALDYSRAFVFANHAVLLNKLSILGFDHASYCWFRSYLSDRLQSVRYTGYVSQDLGVPSGVPQGCVFGPLFFEMYINDLLTSLPEYSSLAYADNVILVVTGKSEAAATEALHVLVNSVAAWSASNGLRINLIKCMWMTITLSLRCTAQPQQHYVLTLRSV